MHIPRILIAGLRGGSGKTLVSLGLAAAWRMQGYGVAPFKKGPDYIDAAWLAMAAGRACRNLDLFLMSADAVLQSFATHGADADVAVIEGNRGLYDGMDARGSYSTAELAKLLQVPVVLVVDCTKSTRTMAALVLGCQRLDPDVPIRGVVLNRTAGARHEGVLREAIQQDCGLPVLGTVPKIREQLFVIQSPGESAVEKLRVHASDHRPKTQFDELPGKLPRVPLPQRKEGLHVHLSQAIPAIVAHVLQVQIPERHGRDAIGLVLFERSPHG